MGKQLHLPNLFDALPSIARFTQDSWKSHRAFGYIIDGSRQGLQGVAEVHLGRFQTF